MQKKKKIVLLVASSFVFCLSATPVKASAENITTSEAPANPSGAAFRVPPDAFDAAESQVPSGYESAVDRKAAGKRKMLIGIAGMGAGVLVGTLATESCLNSFDFSCTGESHAWLLGSLISAGGGGVFLWGLIDWIDGNSEANRLGRTAGAGLLELNEHQAVSLGVGPRSVVSYHVRW